VDETALSLYVFCLP